MRRRATAGFILLAFLGPILGMRVHAQNLTISECLL
jgi:hypothetical protein